MAQEDEYLWYVYDVVDPSLEEIKWSEEGAVRIAPSWIADGTWLETSKRESLISASDIFVSMYERFNWTKVNSFYEWGFVDFDEFAEYVTANPLWWIDDIWQVDTAWYGISENTTRIDCSFSELGSIGELWTWYHVTRIPEYVVGGERLNSWLVGFDLTPISIGNLKTFESYFDANLNGTHYELFFKAPANVLTQHGDNYTLSIGISPTYIGQKSNVQRVIDINMPTKTEVKEMSPANLSLPRGNTATFVISEDDVFPVEFTVLSSPPAKSLGQIIWEGSSLWLFTPAGWAAIATLTVLSLTGLRGRRIWRRSRLYHRMYNSMVTIYDMYSSDVIKFYQEMANVSSSIFKLLIEDKITDEQFERLLVRRDDLLRRVQTEHLKPPG